MTDRAVCIHGHFYQPPREDPWTGEVERQPSAAPYHDWNERITAECYRPNTAARILDGDGRIDAITDNFSRISFDVGPTLFSWLDERAPRVSAAIVEADRSSARRFSGHGSAIAQAYHHTVLPLALERDRKTEVVWGIRDFERRFGRLPEGMWLPETAADVATLETLAEAGIRFTILAPRQAARVRAIGAEKWTPVDEGTLETGRAYRASLPSGRPLALFFYEGAIARAIAFERLLNASDAFAARLTAGGGSGLVHVATDGESYGHHHPHGDMALAAALAKLETGSTSRLTNYGEWLERFPPTHEAEIVPVGSWSCEHGVGRWQRNCGCRLEGGSQEWRTGLREAFDWLRDTVAPAWEEAAGGLFRDPWAARNDAIALAGADAGAGAHAAFFDRHATRALRRSEQAAALSLLDLQRDLLRIYTSCGWFFDDVAGIEARQVILYAARAVELAEETLDLSIEDDFLERLARARGNSAELPDAAAVYRRYVRPPGVLPPRTAALEDPAAALARALDALAHSWEADPSAPGRLEEWRRGVELGAALPTPASLWESQNVYYRNRARMTPSATASGDALDRLGELLGFSASVVARGGTLD